jgi:hypothetical protein
MWISSSLTAFSVGFHKASTYMTNTLISHQPRSRWQCPFISPIAASHMEQQDTKKCDRSV